MGAPAGATATTTAIATTAGTRRGARARAAATAAAAAVTARTTAEPPRKACRRAALLPLHAAGVAAGAHAPTARTAAQRVETHQLLLRRHCFACVATWVGPAMRAQAGHLCCSKAHEVGGSPVRNFLFAGLRGHVLESKCMGAVIGDAAAGASGHMHHLFAAVKL